MYSRSILAIVSCILVLFSVVANARVPGITRSGTATMMKYGTEDAHIRKRYRGTWYSGNDLKNAACYGRSGLPVFSARVTDMIGAMSMRNFEYCYKCTKITNKKTGKSIVVKIVDKCAACTPRKDIDLTPTAFRKLNHDNIEDGVLDIDWKVVECPSTLHLNL
ncbi:unnamed protein product [Cunninghamella echinulata]